MGHADVQTTMRYLHYAPREEDARLVASRSTRPGKADRNDESDHPRRLNWDTSGSELRPSRWWEAWEMSWGRQQIGTARSSAGSRVNRKKARGRLGVTEPEIDGEQRDIVRHHGVRNFRCVMNE